MYPFKNLTDNRSEIFFGRFGLSLGCILSFLLFVEMSPPDKCPAPKNDMAKDLRHLQGRWLCKNDTLYKLQIKDNIIVEYYGNTTLDTFTFVLTHISCDPRYMGGPRLKFMQKKKGDFLYCYEITKVTPGILVMNYLFNGRTYNFRKIKA